MQNGFSLSEEAIATYLSNYYQCAWFRDRITVLTKAQFDRRNWRIDNLPGQARLAIDFQIFKLLRLLSRVQNRLDMDSADAQFFIAFAEQFAMCFHEFNLKNDSELEAGLKSSR